MEAPARIPMGAPVSDVEYQPNGMNGVQFSGLIWNMPTARKTTIVMILTNTMAALIRMLSRIPMINNPISTRMMPMAGKFTNPGSGAKGPLVSVAGKPRPIAVNALLKYPDHPFATAATATPYSRIRSQPMIQASSSPNAAYEYP